MKFLSCAVFLLAFAYGGQSAKLVANEDKTITKVVKLLQGMLGQSKADGDAEAKDFAKYVCDCDSFRETKETTIAEKTKEIAMLESEIQKLQGNNGKLSAESAQLVKDMADNKARRDKAVDRRKNENEAFVAEEADLKGAIGQLEEAIQTLEKIAADQTLSKGADHSQFMSNYKPASLIAKLTNLKAEVKMALKGAVALVPHAKRRPVLDFMQQDAPFTGTYTSQAPAVMGILKNMLDTFESNLDAAIKTESTALAAHQALMKILQESWDDMNKLNTDKQSTLSTNDETLASNKGSLANAINEKDTATSDLDENNANCDKYSKVYSDRKLMRANEEAAIAQAIAILNSDAAFETFGTVSATSTGATGAASFMQLSLGKRRDAGEARHLIEGFLEKMSSSKKSMKIARVVSLLRSGNPFETVLAEIAKMDDLITKEAAQDKENLDMCNTDRTTNDASIKTKKGEILELSQQENTLTDLIENEATGLKKQLAENSISLKANEDEKKSQTKLRTEENINYQKDVKNLVDAERLLTNAIGILQKYYADLETKLTGLVQKTTHAQPTVPDFLKGGYTGTQHGGKKGTAAVSMLEFILEETKKEEAKAHEDENTAQGDYEDSMTALVKSGNQLEGSRIQLEKDLAEAEKNLMMTREDLEKTRADVKSIEDYLASIKPGCDFITANFDIREQNRQTERQSLSKAVGLIKATPAYTVAMAAAHQETLGKCAGICNNVGEDQASCKACLADVTVPGYCAGHPGTPGCP